MWEIRIINLKTNQSFTKTMYTYDYEQFKKKCKYSKKIKIVSEMKVF